MKSMYQKSLNILSLLYKLNLSMDFRVSSEFPFLIFKFSMYSKFYGRLAFLLYIYSKLRCDIWIRQIAH